MNKYLTSIFLLFIGFSQNIAQNIIHLDSEKEVLEFQEYVLILEDKSKTLTAEDIISGKYDSLFQKSSEKGLNFGFNPSNFWVKFKLQNRQPTQKDGIQINQHQWFLENTYPPIDSLVLYYKDAGNTIISSFSGDKVPISQHYYPNVFNTFPLHLSDSSVHTYYLKINTLGSAQIALRLQNSYDFEQFGFFSNLYYGFFIGAMVIMLAYNLFLFIAMRKISYLYYCGYILFYIFSQSALTGVGYYYFWGNYTEFANLISSLGIQISAAFIFMFSFNFLEIPIFLPRLQKSLKFIIAFFILCIISCFFVTYNVHSLVSAVLALFTIIFLLSLGFYALYKGKKYAKYYVSGWSVLLVGTMLYTIKTFGVLPNYFIFNHIHHIGAVIEVLLFSVALADQINRYRKEKQEAQDEAIRVALENEEILAEQNQLLERKVSERTRELQLKQDEVVTQNEELLQQKDEILTQRDHIEEQNMVLTAKDRRIESSIRAAKTIQSAILPFKSKSDSLLKDYFIINRPKDIVSGDFYWLNKVEDQTILVVADCTGHGVQGAFMTVIGNTLLDKIIRVRDVTNPATILATLHDEVEIILSNEEQTNTNNGMDIGLLSWKKVDDNQFELTFSAAKRPLYYIEPGKNEIIEVKGSRKSIGGSVQSSEVVFENHVLVVPKDTVIYMFSDGYADQNDQKRTRLGEYIFKKTLLDIHPQKMEQQKKQLEDLLDNHMKNTTQRDDILLVGFRIF